MSSSATETLPNESWPPGPARQDGAAPDLPKEAVAAEELSKAEALVFEALSRQHRLTFSQLMRLTDLNSEELRLALGGLHMKGLIARLHTVVESLSCRIVVPSTSSHRRTEFLEETPRALIPGNAIAIMILVLTVASAVLLGCGGQTTTSGPTGAAGQSGSVQVVMKNIAFVPANVTIKVGETLTWLNEDSLEHDVVANDGSFKSPILNNGGTFSFTFSKAGSFPYYCAIHPTMAGTVTVQP